MGWRRIGVSCTRVRSVARVVGLWGCGVVQVVVLFSGKINASALAKIDRHGAVAMIVMRLCSAFVNALSVLSIKRCGLGWS